MTSFDAPSPLLPRDPPLRAARWAGLWLLLSATLALAAAALWRLPETEHASVELVAQQAADALQAPVAGELAAIHVSEGATVAAGQVLFELARPEQRAGRAELASVSLREAALQTQRDSAARAHREAVQQLDLELAQAQRELSFREQEVATQRDILARAEQLARSGAMAEVELLKHRLALAQSEKERLGGARSVEGLRLRRQQMQAERDLASQREAEELALLAQRRDTLQREYADGDTRQVRAAYAAQVLRLPARTPGSVVSAGEVLAELTPLDAPLRARLRLPESALASLRPGMPVKLMLTAYPYQRHGVLPARLTRISAAAVQEGESRIFYAEAEILDQRSWSLRPGMSGQARLEISRRSLLTQALDPLRAWQVRQE